MDSRAITLIKHMTDRSLNTTTCLTICGLGVFASPLLGTDLYSVTGSESRSVTPYGDSFKENGSTVARPTQTWGEDALRWGGAKIRAGARVSSIYDDNIIFNSPNRQKDLIWTVTPMFGLGLGDYLGSSGNSLSLQYEPSYVAYTDKTQFNSFDQDVRLAARYAWSKLSIGVSQTYTDIEGGLVEVGNRVRSRIYGTFLGANYDYSEKLFVTLNGRQTISDYSHFNRVNEWLTELTGSWRATEKLRLSLGGAYGVRDVTPGPNEIYEQALIRLGYQAIEKLSVDANLGVEFQQFQDNGSKGPELIFGLDSTWTPREDWSLSLEGHRRNQASVTSGTVNITVTGISGIIRKRIGSRYYLNLASSYDLADYRSVVSGVSSTRNDKYWSTNPSFDCNFTDKLTLSVFYFFRDNHSTGGGISFYNNQVGLKTSYRF